MAKHEDAVPTITDEDRERIQRDLVALAGPSNVDWGAENVLDVWLTEHRVAAERRSSAALARATWVLGAMTLMLVFATVGLLVATLTAA